jgi:hypothetical protein
VISSEATFVNSAAMRGVDNTVCGFGKAQSLTASLKNSRASIRGSDLAIAFGFAGTVDHAKKGVKAVGSRKVTTPKQATCGRPKRARPRRAWVIE